MRPPRAPNGLSFAEYEPYFWRKIHKRDEGDCWEWHCAFHHGYGVVGIERGIHNAHRVAYCYAHGLTLSDIKGKIVCHKCDNRKCCNPAHLMLGDHQLNMDDAVSKYRAPKSKLTEEQVKFIRAKDEWKWGDLSALALQFRVRPSSIARVRDGKSYAINFRGD